MTKTEWFLLAWFGPMVLVIIGFIAFVLYNGSVYPARKDLHGPDPHKRYSAIYTLTDKNDKKSYPEIRKLFNDPDTDVRHSAIYHLVYKLNDKESIPELKKLLNDNRMHQEAVKALKQLGVPEEEIQKTKEGK